jgi:hypothetical protein
MRVRINTRNITGQATSGILSDCAHQARVAESAKAKHHSNDVKGSARGGTAFNWRATFLNDAAHDPKCCEVRQYISWNANGQFATPPHNGFQEPDDQPNHQVEDRSLNGTRFGRRSGPYSALVPPNNPQSDEIIDWYMANGYIGRDKPIGQPGDIFEFQLKVVDVCKGGKTIFTSDAISIKF